MQKTSFKNFIQYQLWVYSTMMTSLSQINTALILTFELMFSSRKPCVLYVFIQIKQAMISLHQLPPRVHHGAFLKARITQDFITMGITRLCICFLPRGRSLRITPAQLEKALVIWCDWDVLSAHSVMFVSLSGWSYGLLWPRPPGNRRCLTCAGRPVASVCCMMMGDGKTPVREWCRAAVYSRCV